MDVSDSSPKAARPPRRESFFHWGWIELLILAAVAIAAACFAIQRITLHEEVRIDTVNGPLAHLDEPAADAAPAAAKGADPSVSVLPAAKP